MILFAEDTDNWNSLAQDLYYEAWRPNKPLKERNNSMDKFKVALHERYEVLERMNAHAHQDPEYFWDNITK